MDTLRTAGRVLGASALAGLAVLLLADLPGLDRGTPFAQLVAFRPVVLAVTGAVLAVPIVVTLLRRRARWGVAALVAVLLLGAGTVATRVLPDGAGAGTPLTVLTANVYDGEASVHALAALVADERPDLVSLPEAGADYRARLAPLVEPLGYRVFGSTGEGVPDVDGVSALARTGLGDLSVSVDETTPFPSVVVTGGALGGVRFVAFHSFAPVPARIAQWRIDLAHLSRWCAGGGPAIVAGDFNATLDHSPFRAGTAGCADAAEQAGTGLVGTWPARLPRWLGAQIDHVVVTDGITTRSAEIRDLPGSDHRAVLARLVVPAG